MIYDEAKDGWPKRIRLEDYDDECHGYELQVKGEEQEAHSAEKWPKLGQEEARVNHWRWEGEARVTLRLKCTASSPSHDESSDDGNRKEN